MKDYVPLQTTDLTHCSPDKQPLSTIDALAIKFADKYIAKIVRILMMVLFHIYYHTYHFIRTKYYCIILPSICQ